MADTRAREEFDFTTFPQPFPSFPSQLPPEAQDDYQRHGREVAVFNEWLRFRFDPALLLLDQRVAQLSVDRAQVRDTLVISQEWRAFTNVAYRNFTLPPDRLDQLDERKDSFRDLLGSYWKMYYNAFEGNKCRRVGALPKALHPPVRQWFRAAGLDFDYMAHVVKTQSSLDVMRSLGIRYSGDGDLDWKLIWNIFLAGVASHSSSDGTKMPNATFRQNPEWQSRFTFFSRAWSSGGKRAIKDPVTFGGAVALLNNGILYVDRLDTDEDDRMAYIMQNVFFVIHHVLYDLRMPAPCAVQAISIYVEMSSL